MKINKIMEECRKNITPEIDKFVEISVNIANAIYNILEAENISIKNFADKMGVTEEQVTQWLSGTYNLDIETIAKISVILDWDIIFFSQYDPKFVKRIKDAQKGPFVRITDIDKFIKNL